MKSLQGTQIQSESGGYFEHSLYQWTHLSRRSVKCWVRLLLSFLPWHHGKCLVALHIEFSGQLKVDVTLSFIQSEWCLQEYDLVYLWESTKSDNSIMHHFGCLASLTNNFKESISCLVSIFPFHNLYLLEAAFSIHACHFCSLKICCRLLISL